MIGRIRCLCSEVNENQSHLSQYSGIGGGVGGALGRSLGRCHCCGGRRHSTRLCGSIWFGRVEEWIQEWCLRRRDQRCVRVLLEESRRSGQSAVTGAQCGAISARSIRQSLMGKSAWVTTRRLHRQRHQRWRMRSVTGPLAVIAMTVASAPESSAGSSFAPRMHMVVRWSWMRMRWCWRRVIVIPPITSRIGRLLLPAAWLFPLIVLQPSGLVFDRWPIAASASASCVRSILTIAFAFPIALSFPLSLPLVRIPVGLRSRMVLLLRGRSSARMSWGFAPLGSANKATRSPRGSTRSAWAATSSLLLPLAFPLRSEVATGSNITFPFAVTFSFPITLPVPD